MAKKKVDRNERRRQWAVGALAALMILSAAIPAIAVLMVNDDEESTADPAAAATCTSAQVAGAPLPVPETKQYDEPVTELEVTDVKPGTGKEVKAGDCITVHYHGTNADDGTVFDSTYQKGTPATFELNGLIEGWQEGIPGMKEGGIRRLAIPAKQAYGGLEGHPLQKKDLVFVIELVKIEK